jgi:hypothetical protein
MGLAQKFKKCIMHASHLAYSNFFSTLFETPPNHPTTQSSTTTTLWTKFTVASPPPHCLLVFGRIRREELSTTTLPINKKR